MKYNLVNWSGEYRNDGIAYMNQRIQEMLSHFADHVFSVPVCNTIILLKEFIGTSTLVKVGKVNSANLKIIMDEFQYSFNDDLIIRKHFDEKLAKEIIGRINSASTEEQVRLMGFLHNKLADYYKWCKEDLRELVLREKEKKKIEKVLRSYITGLIGGGYSRSFIYYLNNKVFNKFQVTSESSLDEFLNRFDFIRRKYIVYVGVDKELFRFKDVLTQRLGASFDCESEAEDLKRDKKYSVVKFEIESLDPCTAANNAQENLKLFTDFYKFLNDKKASWIASSAKVVEEDGTISFVKINDEDFSFSRRIEKIDRGEYVEMMVSTLVFAVPQVFPLFQRIVDLHNTSIERSNLNNAFLNLWSILELLFVYDHTDSKVNELKKKLLPILQQDYMRFVFDKLNEDLFDNIPKDTIEMVFPGINFNKEINKFPSIILLPKYESERKQLNTILIDYPIIRSRICQFNELYSRKNKVLADIERFSRRVEWHIHRLYRARNAIIHSGSNASNIKELSRHLHNYVDEAVMEVLYLILYDNSISSIDSAVIEMQLHVDLLFKRLASKEALNDEDIIELFIPHIMKQEYLLDAESKEHADPS